MLGSQIFLRLVPMNLKLLLRHIIIINGDFWLGVLSRTTNRETDRNFTIITVGLNRTKWCWKGKLS